MCAFVNRIHLQLWSLIWPHRKLLKARRGKLLTPEAVQLAVGATQVSRPGPLAFCGLAKQPKFSWCSQKPPDGTPREREREKSFCPLPPAALLSHRPSSNIITARSLIACAAACSTRGRLIKELLQTLSYCTRVVARRPERILTDCSNTGSVGSRSDCVCSTHKPQQPKDWWD